MLQKFIPLVSALVMLAGCGGAASRQTTHTDTAAIRQLYRDWPRTIDAGDANRYVRFLDDSVTLLMPGAAPLHGVSAYRELLTPLFQSATYRVSLEPPTLLQVAGPWAFAHYRGQYVTFPRPTGDSSVGRNRYVDILRKQANGSWRVFLHSWHEDVAPAR